MGGSESGLDPKSNANLTSSSLEQSGNEEDFLVQGDENNPNPNPNSPNSLTTG